MNLMQNLNCLENLPGSAKPVMFITTIALVLVFHSLLAGEAEVGSSAVTRPRMQNISMARLALWGYLLSLDALAPPMG
jgi:hypothetical protein